MTVMIEIELNVDPKFLGTEDDIRDLLKERLDVEGVNSIDIIEIYV